MRRLIAALILASTIFLTATFAKDVEPPTPPEELPPISPAYVVPSVLVSLEERRQAHERALRAEAEAERIARAEEIERKRIAAEEQRKRALLAKKIASKPKATAVQPSRSQAYVGKARTYEATAYTSRCSGCSGITKTGVNLRQSIFHEGRRVIAVDPRYIPLGTIVRVTLSDGSSFEAIAEDTGGAIRGQIIDVAHETKADANRFGRQSVEVRMIRKGR